MPRIRSTCDLCGWTKEIESTKMLQRQGRVGYREVHICIDCAALRDSPSRWEQDKFLLMYGEATKGTVPEPGRREIDIIDKFDLMDAPKAGITAGDVMYFALAALLTLCVILLAVRGSG